MKKRIYLFLVILIFSQCSNRFVKKSQPRTFEELGRPDKMIDLTALMNLINEDSLKISENHSYRKANRVISYKGLRGEFFRLAIKNNFTTDEMMVYRRGYKLSDIDRVVEDKNQSKLTYNYQYYPTGIIRRIYVEKNIQKLINDSYLRYIKVGEEIEFDRFGVETRHVNYDKEFSFKLNKVLRLYSKRIDKKYAISVKQIFVAHDLIRTVTDDLNYRSYWNFRFKFEYPFWEVEFKDSKTGSNFHEVLDGKTGTVIYKIKYSLKITE